MNIAELSTEDLRLRIRQSWRERVIYLVLLGIPCLMFGLYWFDILDSPVTEEMPGFIAFLIDSVTFPVGCVITGVLLVVSWVLTGSLIDDAKAELAKRVHS